MNRNILITGSSGNLGNAIISSHKFKNLLTPTNLELDICNKNSIEKFFQKSSLESIVHCAAVSTRKEAEEFPEKALKTNIEGTTNLVRETLKYGVKEDIPRFIYISTDAVYSGNKGNYSEMDETMPTDIYGWTKLGGECSVRVLPNYCIIRTSFFDPKKINFREAPTDIYTSKITLNKLVDAVEFLLKNNFIGVVNVGRPRISNFDLYKKYRPSLKATTSKKIEEKLGIELNRDLSMDVSLWRSLK